MKLKITKQKENLRFSDVNLMHILVCICVVNVIYIFVAMSLCNLSGYQKKQKINIVRNSTIS